MGLTIIHHRLALFFLLMLSFPCSPLAARENKELMKANYYYAHYAYHEAIPHYERVADELNTSEVYAQLADCYNITGSWQKAAEAYGKAAAIKDCSPAVLLRYAQLLMQLEQYERAEQYLVQYLKNNKNDRRAANLIAGSRLYKNTSFSAPHGIALLLPFNTDGSEFAPALWKDRLVFASDTVIDIRKKTDKGTGKAYYNIYSVPCNGEGLCGGSINTMADDAVNIKYHNGPATFSADGGQMYYTRSRYASGLLTKKAVANKDSMVVLEIMIATDLDTASGRFRTIVPFSYNDPGYAVAHPSVSPGGGLLAFSSNMPRGYGRSDIYLCRKVNGAWASPRNAGAMVNAEGDEVFPYWADDSTLFFSSDGQKGMGGLDIYKCRWDNKRSVFAAPVNVGAPVNSSYDDISLAMYADGRSSYFSSARPATRGGDNIYFFKRNELCLQLTVTDSISRQELAGARLSISRSQHRQDTVTGPSGKYIAALYPGERYDITVSMAGYTASTLAVTAISDKDIDTVFRHIALLRMPKDTIIPIAPPIAVRDNNIMDTPGVRAFVLNEVYEIGHFYYDYDKYELKSVHKVFLDSLVIQLKRHSTMRIQVRAHTDCRGSADYNLKLSHNRAMSVVSYLAAHGISRGRLQFAGLGYTMSHAQCADCSACTEEEHYRNRVLEFKVLAL